MHHFACLVVYLIIAAETHRSIEHFYARSPRFPSDRAFLCSATSGCSSFPKVTSLLVSAYFPMWSQQATLGPVKAAGLHRRPPKMGGNRDTGRTA